MGPGDVMAFVVLMATLGVLGVAFSPIGRALGERLRGKQRDAALVSGEFEVLREEVAQLRVEVEGVQDRLRNVDEIENRLDFAERMLAQVKERGLLSPPKER